jgi:hypothetical protein
MINHEKSSEASLSDRPVGRSTFGTQQLGASDRFRHAHPMPRDGTQSLKSAQMDLSKKWLHHSHHIKV